jgi:hypothetical protein
LLKILPSGMMPPLLDKEAMRKHLAGKGIQLFD